MSRLIDADALVWVLKHSKTYHKVIALDVVLDAVRCSPTIDAVEVVRCKDCKDIFFDDWYKCFSCANLYGLNEEVKPNDFCSHGERKESE